jgi:hypothetical protein
MIHNVPDFRIIPSIEILRQRAGVRELEAQHGVEATVTALRAGADGLRSRIAAGDAIGQARGSLRPVINATGVVIHTNLGRAPLAEVAIARISAIARGYSNLEYDVNTGERGSRTVHAESLLTQITGAEAAIVVNNNAAATLLILAGLASGRDVVISRGELVEIGGGFRVPDVLRRHAARGRHDQSHARDGLHGGGVTRDCAVLARASVQFSNRRVYRAAVAERSRRRCARDERAGGRRHRQRMPGGRCGGRTIGAGLDCGGR